MAMLQQRSATLGTRAEARSAGGVVSAGHAQAVRAALLALEQGGNAIDAVIAGAFAAFVAEPNNAGIGGYGHLGAFLADGTGFLTIDYGPRAPAAARGDSLT
jgi:gamma-glutamyltranspeptidase / glutathione hydrolase